MRRGFPRGTYFLFGGAAAVWCIRLPFQTVAHLGRTFTFGAPLILFFGGGQKLVLAGGPVAAVVRPQMLVEGQRPVVAVSWACSLF